MREVDDDIVSLTLNVMNLITIIAVLLTSLLFTVVFCSVLKCRGPWGSWWTFFTIVSLWLTAVSLWIPPAAPIWFGAPWIDLLMTGLLVSFVLSATSIDSSTSRSIFQTDPSGMDDVVSKNDVTKQPQGRDNASNDLGPSGDLIQSPDSDAVQKGGFHTGGVFWMLLLCLCALIIIGAV